MSLPTLTDLKAETNIPNDTSDDELQSKLDQAINVVEGIVGPLALQTVVETHYDLWWAREILLRRPRVVDLVSVTERTSLSSTFADVEAADCELNVSAGTLRTRNSRRLSGDVTVTYSIGREDIPSDISGAIVIIAAHLWETQRGTSPTALSLQQGDLVDAGTFGAGYAIPNRAKELLAPHVRASIA